MPNPTYLFILKCLVDFLSRGTRGLLRAMSLAEQVGWGTSLVWPKSEAIDPALDNFPGKCTELECVIKLINNLEGAGPPKS